jgi:hypothetical protein
MRRVALWVSRICSQWSCRVVSFVVMASEQEQVKVISNDQRPSHLPAHPQIRRLRGPEVRHREGPPWLPGAGVLFSARLWDSLSIEVSMTNLVSTQG